MNKHKFQHVISEIWLLVLLGAPVIGILATLIGFAIYEMGYIELGLWICAISFGACMFLQPFARRALSKPDTRLACECGGTRRQA